jgi:hypothetical protein
VQSLVEALDDFNYGMWAGRALRPLATPDDVPQIVALANSVEGKIAPDADDDKGSGFTSGAAELLAEIDISVIREAFLPGDETEPLSNVKARILRDILYRRHSTVALELAAELLIRGVDGAAFAIQCISRPAKASQHLSWAVFTTDHVERLLPALDKEESWALGALKSLCAARPDMAEVVGARASRASGIAKAALLYCLLSEDGASVFEALAEFAEMSPKERAEQSIHLLGHIELDWSGHEALFVKLLRLKDKRVASALMGGGVPVRKKIGELHIGPIEWWLEWLFEESVTTSAFFFCEAVASLLAGFADAEAREAFVAELNRSGSRFRKSVARILAHCSDLTTDAFSEDANSFLLADLSRGGSADGFNGHLLGTAATEQFVIERLLPLLADAKPPLSGNLRKVLTQAGSRHGRRYVFA